MSRRWHLISKTLATIWVVLFVLPAGAAEHEGYGNDVVTLTKQDLDRLNGHTKMATARFISDQGQFAVIEVAGDYDRDLADGSFNVDPRVAVAEAFFENHDDEYDFLVVFSTFEFSTPGARAFYLGVRNDIEGIGQQPFDNSAFFGSSRLQGYIDLAAFTRYELDSLQPDFDSTLDTMVHEVMHRWGVYTQYQDAAGQPNDSWLGFQDAHWSQYVSSQASVMGGAQWRDNADGSFTALDIRRGYSDADLYLAGFLGPNDAADLFYIRNPGGDPDAYWPVPGDVTGGTAENVSIAQIIAAEGPRVPAAGAAQKAFRAGFVVLVRPGTFPSDGLLFGLNEAREAVSDRFSVETRGLGILKTGLAEADGPGVNDPDTIVGGPAAGGLADFSTAVDWLLAVQDPSGFWGDRPQTRLRDTALALRALRLLEIDRPALLQARNWIRGQLALDNDDRAWLLASGALNAQDTTALYAGLAQSRSAEGGWGLTEGDSASAYDTANILAYADNNLPSINEAISYLQSSRRAGSGWGALSSGNNQVVTTAVALKALVGAEATDSGLDEAVAWLLGGQVASGVFGQGAGSAHETALALDALGLFSSVPPSAIEAASSALEGLQSADGSWAGSVYSTSLAINALRNRANPNLAIGGAIEIEPVAVRDGDLVSVAFTVTNSGLFNTPSVLAQAFVGDPAAGGVAIASAVPIPTLQPGEDVDVQTFWDTQGLAGSQTLFVFVDSTSQLAEATEADNLATRTVSVAPAPTQPDLTVLANSLNFSPTVVGALPTQFEAQANVRNVGTGDAGAITVALQRRRPDGQWVTLVSEVVDVAARATQNVNLAAQLSEAGVIELRINLDPDDQLAEADESNNLLEFDVATAAALDLAVLATEMQLLTPSPEAGQDVNFQFVLRNLGTVDAPPVSFTAAVEFAGNTEILLEQTVQLVAGQADTRNLAWRASGVGNGQLIVTVDSNSQAIEGDESNNVAALDFTVGSVSLPNLAVNFEDLTFSPEPALESQPLLIEIPVINASDVAAGAYQVELYNGVPGEGGTLIEVQNFTSLAAGAQELVQVTTPALTGGGQRLYYVSVDPTDQVSEFDETDNTAFDQVQVLRLPDLAITAANVVLAPTLPVPGSPVSANITIDNLGQQPAADVEVQVFEVASGGSQSLVAGPVSISAIDADNSALVTVDWTFGSDVSQLLVQVDPADQVLEIDNSNNQALVRTDLQNQTFFVSERYISPNGDTVKDVTAIGYNVASADVGSIVIDDSVGRQVRQFGAGELSSTERGQVVWNGRSTRGSIVRDGNYQARLLTETGELLSQTLIVVDTNRTPLLEAVNTQAAYYSDLRCSVESISSPQFSADGRHVYSTQIRDLNGDSRSGLFRVPARGRGLDQLLTDTFISQLSGGTFISDVTPLPDGRLVFANGAGCSNCARGMWIKSTPLAQPVALDIGPANQFDVFRAGPDHALIEDEFDNLWKVFYDPTIPAQQLQSPGTSMNFWAEVNGGWLMSRFFSGDFFGNNVFGEHLYFISADPGVGFTEIIFGPEVSFQISSDRRYVAAFASENQFEFSAPASGLLRAARLTGTVPEIYFEQSLDLGDQWDIHVAMSPSNQLLVLDGNAATVSVYDPSGGLQGQMQLPTQLFNDYADAVPPDQVFSGPTEPFTAFARWRPWLNPDNVDRTAVTFSTDTDEFLVELALVYPDGGGGEKSNQQPGGQGGQKSVPFNTHVSQFFRASLSGLEPVLVGSVRHEADESIIFPQALPDINPFQLNWLAREDRLLLERSGLFDTLELVPNTGIDDLELGRLGDAWPRDTGSMYRKIHLTQYLQTDDLKCSGRGQPTPILESADNLIAHLEVSRFASVIELSGVAADRFLQSYQLDWAIADDPDTWFTLTSASNETIIDDLLATWVPPTAGSFLIRLRVTDLAGNVAEDIRSVNWLDPANLTNVELTPRFLSPNGDGVKDQATLSFRVLQPINLEVTIENSAGQVVRNLSGQYPTITGNIESLAWDGRDNNGNLVGEDTYLMRVENRRFRITVDITPPLLALELPRAYQSDPQENQQELVGAVYELSGILEEANLELGLLEFRRGNEPWNELQLYSVPPDDNEIELAVGRELFVPAQFRLSATDLAGNRAQILASNLFEDLILRDLRQAYFIRGIDVSRPPEKRLSVDRLEFVQPPVTPAAFPNLFVPVVSDRVGLTLDLTYGDPVDQYYIELAEPDNLNDWVSIPTSPAPLASPENFEDLVELNSRYRHLFLLALADLQGLEDVYVRIRADIAGSSYYSNGMRLRLDPGLKRGTMRGALSQIAEGELEPEQDVELIRLLNQQVPLKEPAITQFWVRESLLGMPQDARLLVSSNDDARYFNETAFLAVTDAQLVPPSEFSIQMYEVPTSPCRSYTIRWEAEFPDGNGGTRPIQMPESTVSRSCLSITTERFVAPGDFCAESSPGIVQLRVELSTADPDILPISLDVFDRDVTGEELLIANVVAPRLNTSYALDINLNTLVTGQRALRMRVVDSVGDVTESRVFLPVDRVRPQVALDFPADGQQLCAVQDINGRIQLPLEGLVSDDFSGDFTYQARLGSGHATPSYQTVGGTPDFLEPEKIACTYNQPYVSEECLNESNTGGELGLYSFPDEHEFMLSTGPTSALVEAMDWSGRRYCAVSRFDLDASVDVRVASEYGLFSPNSDGVLDSASILIQALEPLTMSITVHAAVRTSDGDFSLGPALAQLAAGQPIDGDINFDWLGDDGAAVLPDGRYGLRFEFTDSCGLIETLDSVGEIDNTPPFVAIDYPTNNDPVTAIVEILGRFNDPNFLSANVDYGTDDIWINLQNHNRSVFSSQPIATWVLTGLPTDTYNLRLQASDRAGNEAETVVSLAIDQLTSLIWALQAEPAYLSPNGDGIQDATQIGLGVEDTGLFTVDIRTTADTLIHRLTDAQQLTAGSYNFEWDGTNTAGDTVADGDYVVQVTATDLAQTGFSQTESIAVVVDTVAPDLFLTRPGQPVIQGRGTYVFNTLDDHFASVRVFEQSLEPAGSEVLVTEELQAGSYNSGDLSVLAEGRHQVRLQATDLAGNATLIEREFVVDNTPPEVSLLTPVADALLGGTDPLVPITGRVADANFEQYELAVRLTNSNDPWQVIATDTTLPTDELLTEWTVALADGNYSLRLLATDLAGLQASVSVVVNVDTTPPLAIISAPAPETLVTIGAAITGTATDTNFKQYRLRLAEAGDPDPVWSDVAIRDTAVNGGLLLEFASPPPDGRYRLQLLVEDSVGLSATAETIIVVDQTPPQPPTNLRAEVQPGFNVRLDWDAGSAPDLAGYIVYRNTIAINSQPVVPVSTLDLDVPEGEHDYTVVAVDSAGNQSEPTNTATIAIDRTPPSAVLITPAEGDRVRGVIPLLGTAFSADDFFEYRVYVRPEGTAAPGELLAQSPVSVTGEQLATWDTTTAVQDQTYVVLLEAEDTSGNVGSDERRVLVDNLPPAAPSGLIATLQGANDGQLDWSPNLESDLAGYLLFRNGQLVNSSGDAGADLLPFVLTSTTYLDPGLADGIQTWQVFAIDAARNLSAGSNTVELTIETGPPETLITEPDDGERFEEPLRIVAMSPDLDVQSVQFEYRAVGAAGWILLGPADTDAPFQSTLDPASENLTFGDFEIRASATDTGGATDPTPAIISVTYADLTPPDAAFNLEIAIDGGTVTLTWEHPDPAGVDEFLIYRGIDVDDLEEWDAVNGSALSFVDSNLPDGDYLYFVTAADAELNESEATSTLTAVVHTPQFDHPFTPTQRSDFNITGQSRVVGTISGQLQTDAGTTDIGAANVAADGSFDLGTLPLTDGSNSLQFRIQDAAGNLSKPGIAVVRRGTGPSAPVSPATAVTGFDVTFSWDAPPEPNVVGYRPMRDGQPLIADEAITGATFIASSSGFPPTNVSDGNQFTYWYPLDSDLADVNPTFIEAQFAEPRLFTQVDLIWRSSRRPTDYAIEAFSGAVWVPVARVTQNVGSSETVPLVQPYYTSRLRMVVLDYNRGFFRPVRLAEFSFSHRPLNTATQFAETRPDGSFDYTASAINDLGFEGPTSAVATADVGDTEPPPAVVLSGSIAGSDINLSWTEAVAPDLVEYRLLRDGQPLAIQTDLASRSYLDPGLVNGTYNYQVLAADAFGNVSEPSNVVTLTVGVNDVMAPQNLVVSEVPGGGALDLAWEAGPGAAPSAFRVSRSVQSGGPYNDVIDTQATTLRDTDLTNATTYYYVVYALDAVGNLAGPSNEDSGTPLDNAAPAAPVIQFPTVAGQPVTINALAVDLAGEAEPGVGVEITRNGELAGTVTSAEEFTLILLDPGQDIDNGLVSPDGRYVAQRNSPFRLIALPSGEVTNLPANFGQMRWAADSASIYVADFSFRGELRRYSVDGQLLDTIVTGWDRIDFGAPSPDNQRFLLAGSTVNPATDVLERGIYVVDRNDDSLVRLGTFDSGLVSFTHVHWTSDSRYVVFVEREGTVDLQIYDAETGVLQVLQPNVSFRAPSISRDDGQVAFSASSGGLEQIFSVSLTGGTAVQLTDGLQSYREPRWSLSDRYLGYLSGCCEVIISDLLVGGTIFSTDVDFVEQLRWLDNDQLYAGFSADYANIVAPGFFQLQDMPLVGGDNEVIATAFDNTGNFSPQSLPILIQVPDTGFPDLSIAAGDLVVLPAGGAPGDSFQVNLLVRNLGLAPAPAAQVALRLVYPDGSSEDLVADKASVTLAGGAQRSFTVAVGPLVDEGSYQLVAVVDPDGLIDEVNENNNLQEASLLITSSTQPLMTLRTNQREFAPGEVIAGAVTLYNPGTPFSGRVEVTAEDQSGFVFNFNQSSSVEGLEFAQTLNIPVAWDPGNLFSGTYRLRARLFDAGGQVVQEAASEFEIGRLAEFALTLSATQSNFQPSQQADFAADLRLVEGNVAITDGVLNWQAIAPSGATVWTATSPLGTMVQGFRTSALQSWPVDNAATGTYRIRVELSSSDAFAEAELLVNVVPPDAVLSLTGSLGVDTPVIAIGRQFDVAWSAENSGTVDVSDVPVSIRLLRTAGLAPLLTEEFTLSLVAGSQTDALITWDSSVLGFESYLIVLSADLSALGGSVNTVLDSASISGIDATPPLITILDPADGEITNADVQLTARVVDALSAIERVTVQVDGAAESTMGVASETAQYQRWLFDLSEGPHSFQISAEDVWGNQAQSTLFSFVVDRTPPVIDILGVSNGALLNVPVQPVVTVTDNNLDTVITRLNGDDFTPGTTVINTDGSYVLTVVATDLAGNRSEAEVGFVLDFTPPLVTVTFPANGAVVQTPTTVVTGSTEPGALVSISAGGFSAQSVADSTGAFSFTAVPLTVGDNLLTLSAVDTASNQGPDTILTLIFGDATIEIGGSLTPPVSPHPVDQPLTVAYTISNDGNTAATELPVRVQLVDAGTGLVLATSSSSLDVAPAANVPGSATFTAGTLATGLHRLELAAQIESVWTALDMTVVTIADLTPPQVSLLQPLAGSLFSTEVEVLAQATDVSSAIDRVEYVLDQGAPTAMVLDNPPAGRYQAALTGLADGPHTLAIQAVDSAANQSSTPAITFEVDALPPVIEINGVDKGGLYNESVTPVIAVSDDNPDVVTITLNGQPFVSGTAVNSEDIYLLEVVATDLVGNTNTDSAEFEIDLTGPIVQILSPADGAAISATTTPVSAITEANAVVTLMAGAYSVDQPADGNGNVTFAAVPVGPGANTITLNATDRAGNQGADASIIVNGVQTLHCAFSGEIDEIDRELNSEFKKRDLLVGTLALNLSDGSISELDALLGDYPFSAIPGGPTIGFENNVGGIDRITISGEDEFEGSIIKRRSLVNFQIALEDDASWLDSLNDFEGQVWEERLLAEWQLNFSPRDMNSTPGGGGQGLGPARVLGTITGFCTTVEQVVENLAPLILRAQSGEVTTRFTRVEGTTRPGALVTLTVPGYTNTGIADSEGRIVFFDVPLSPGLNNIELVAVSGDQTSNLVILGVMGPAAAIPTLSWLGVLLLTLMSACMGATQFMAGKQRNWNRGGHR